MSFGGHQNYAQQWVPDSSAAPSPDGVHRPYHPHPQNFPPPPLYPTPGGYYPIPPNFPNANGILPPRPPLPFPNAMPPYPPYGAAPPVPPLGFPPFPPIPHPHPASEVVSGTSIPRLGMNAAPGLDSPQEQVSGESPETLDSDEREEGELSAGEMEENDNGTRSEPKPKGDRQYKAGRRDYDLNQGQPSNKQAAAEGPGNGSVKGSTALIVPQNRFFHAPSNDLTPLSEENGNDVEMSDVSVVGDGPNALLDSKSPIQLRTLAQGALLNLAPHNIRFDELVREGIDPSILRDLYAGIGIKITSTETGDKTPSDEQHELAPEEIASTFPSASAEKSTSFLTPSEPEVSITTEQQSLAANTKQTASATKEQPVGINSASKPLERKELIARMLAAKAGKPVSSDSTPTISNMQLKDKSELALIPSNQPAVNVTDTTMGKSNEQGTPSAAAAEARVKEINKAQTELARQRMEQLKKQGLKRSQSHSESVTVSTSNEINNDLLEDITQQSASQAASLRHPLPERPPKPEEVASTRIPGLFMTEADSSTTGQPPKTVESPTQQDLPAAKTRKRPRASDFLDDDVTEEMTSKKPTLSGTLFPGTDHRVVIDISEDESMYGTDDDNVGGNQASDKIAGLASRPVSGLPLRGGPRNSRFPSTNGYSQLSTPAGSLPQTPKGQQHLESEIQNLRQQIAEMEKRRKEKLAAAQSQSAPTSVPLDSRLPETLSNVPSSDISPEAGPQEVPSAAGPEVRFKNPADSTDECTIDAGASALNFTTTDMTTNSPLSRSRSSLGPGEIAGMRQKLLRKQEIESGLPILEAELQKSAAKLAYYQEEERKLLEEIAKGKAGRLKLVEELESLGIETDGLTMEELKATKDALENDVVPDSENPGDVTEQTGDLQPADTIHAKPANFSGQTSSEQSGVQSAASFGSSEMMIDESVPMILEDDDRASRSSSAMDESMGSDDSDVEQLPESEEPMDLVGDSNVPTPDIAESTAQKSFDAPESFDTMQVDQPNVEKTASREFSVSSDAYEPPEPEASGESDRAYSPPDSVEPLAVKPQGGATEPVEQRVPDDRDEAAAESMITEQDENQTQSNRHYVPYESPLSNFKAYRYHPQFADNIKGGFRSLTYSHNINPSSPLCAYEIYGGVCNDRDCQYQHLRDLSLSDDRILVEMGSLREGNSQKEQDEYVAGLRQIINDMRRDKVKDFATVATEIAAYRRRFLQDPSRVLAL